jgi:hypothetical protein
VRAEWEGEDSRAPFLVTFGDNYFDLLPGESKTLDINLLLPPDHSGEISGRLMVERSNTAAQQIAVRLHAQATR